MACTQGRISYNIFKEFPMEKAVVTCTQGRISYNPLGDCPPAPVDEGATDW